MNVSTKFLDLSRFKEAELSKVSEQMLLTIYCSFRSTFFDRFARISREKSCWKEARCKARVRDLHARHK